MSTETYATIISADIDAHKRLDRIVHDLFQQWLQWKGTPSPDLVYGVHWRILENEVDVFYEDQFNDKYSVEFPLPMLWDEGSRISTWDKAKRAKEENDKIQQLRGAEARQRWAADELARANAHLAKLGVAPLRYFAGWLVSIGGKIVPSADPKDGNWHDDLEAAIAAALALYNRVRKGKEQ